MSKALEKLESLGQHHCQLMQIYCSEDCHHIPCSECIHFKEEKLIEEELEALETIKENLKYGYVFIGYDKDNKPLFQFADTKLYEEIKKNIIK